MRTPTAILSAALTALALLPATAAAAGARDVMYVGNNWDGTADIVDPVAYKRLARLNIIPDIEQRMAEIMRNPVDYGFFLGIREFVGEGHDQFVDDMFSSPDGRFLYVSRPSLRDVVAFDLTTRRIVWRVQVEGNRSDHMAISPDGSRLLVSASTAKKVHVIDTAAGRIVANFPSGDQPHENNYSADGNLIFHASIGAVFTPTDDPMFDGTKGERFFQVVDGRTFQVLKRVNVGQKLAEFGLPGMSAAVRPMAISPDEKTFYFQVSFFHGFVEYDLVRDRITRTVELPISEDASKKRRDEYLLDSAHHGLTMNPEGTKLCVAGTMSDYAAIVDRASFRHTIASQGSKPYWSTNAGDGRHCFISYSGDDSVSVVSYATGREVARIRVGDHPQRMRMGRILDEALATAPAPGPARPARPGQGGAAGEPPPPPLRRPPPLPRTGTRHHADPRPAGRRGARLAGRRRRPDGQGGHRRVGQAPRVRAGPLLPPPGDPDGLPAGHRAGPVAAARLSGRTLGAVLPAHVRVAIVGGGFAGLGMAIRLKQTGVEDFVVLERGSDVGGTWRENDYPGAACDVPSRLYSFSFAPNPEWSRSFSPQGEILDYLRDCAERFGIRPHLRLGCTVESVAWEQDAARWRVQTTDGELTADVLVSAAGALSAPRTPPLKGIESFSGRVFHSAAWDHDHDLTGERVAVIGTGASAVQIVPQIVSEVERLDLYQRTPAWIVPRTDRTFSALERRAYRRFPGLQRLAREAIYWSRELYVLGFAVDRRLMRIPERIARSLLAAQVGDRRLREKLTPDYTIGCKRILVSSDFYPALGEPSADVVTSPIAEICERSIITADGVERPTDTIVMATGFQVTPPPIAEAIRGRHGTRLLDVWRERGMQAHRGTTVAGFPNLFLLVGPNTGLGHTSMVYVIESQVRYVLEALRAMQERGLAAIEPRPEAQAAFNRGVAKRLESTVWSAGGCASWYLDDHGRNTTLWPWFTFRLRGLLSRFDAESYELRPARARGAPAA